MYQYHRRRRKFELRFDQINISFSKKDFYVDRFSRSDVFFCTFSQVALIKRSFGYTFHQMLTNGCQEHKQQSKERKSFYTWIRFNMFWSYFFSPPLTQNKLIDERLLRFSETKHFISIERSWGKIDYTVTFSWLDSFDFNIQSINYKFNVI